MSKRAAEAALKAYQPIKINRDGEIVQPGYDKRTRNIYQEGYEQAEKDLGWHSVEESLPPIDEEVIVLTDDLDTAPVYKIALGHIVDRRYAMDYNGWNIPGVKYWMPMPKLPKE